MPGSDSVAIGESAEVQYCSDKGCFAIKLPSSIAQGCGLVQELNGAEGVTTMPFEVPSFLRWMDFVLKERQSIGKVSWEPAELGWIIQVCWFFCVLGVLAVLCTSPARPRRLSCKIMFFSRRWTSTSSLHAAGPLENPCCCDGSFNRHRMSCRLRASCKTTVL